MFRNSNFNTHNNAPEVKPEGVCANDIRHHHENDDDARIQKMAKRKLVSSELEGFIRYLNSPWQIIWRNILAGLARGLGAVFGATVIVGLAIWVLKMFIDMPLIGEYAQQVRKKVDEVAQEARYSDDFVRLQHTMDRIDSHLESQNELLEQVLENEQSEIVVDENTE